VLVEANLVARTMTADEVRAVSDLAVARVPQATQRNLHLGLTSSSKTQTSRKWDF